MVDTYIFDLDGTLLDSMDLWEQIDIDFLARKGICASSDYIEAINSYTFRQAAEYTIKRYNLKDSADELIGQWNDMAIYAYGHTIELKPYAKQYLESLKRVGVKLGVATSLPPVLYKPALRNHGLDKMFDGVYSTDEVSWGKDRPDIFYYAAEKLGSAPSSCILFEDTLEGIISGKQTGMTVYAVYDKSSKEQWTIIKETAHGLLYDFKNPPLPLVK